MSTDGFDLALAALTAMRQSGFSPDLPEGAGAQVSAIRASAGELPAGTRDLRGQAWSSIDNDTSKDLDQIEVAEESGAGVRLRVGIADVAEWVAKGTPLDEHAAAQTATIYTPARIFPMLPVELSTDLTSLGEGAARAAIVIEFTVAADGAVSDPAIYEATVTNQAQLAYSRAGAWLAGGDAGADAKIAASPALAEQLRLQDRAAQALRAARLKRGALEFERPEADPVLVNGGVELMQAAGDNRAVDLISELMIAANEVVAKALGAAGRSSLRRVVRSPERWSRIVQLAADQGGRLPAEPSSSALSAFLLERRAADPVRYPDLSLAVIKLMGPGETVLSRANDKEADGHFGLATKDYTHATAPNRRFADLVTQRLVKAMLGGQPSPYSDDELAAIATHCNEREAATRKLERAMRKRAEALSLSSRIGAISSGVVTGAGSKGTYVRIFKPAVEGRVTAGDHGLDVGDVITVKLVRADPQLGFIDFARIGAATPA